MPNGSVTSPTLSCLLVTKAASSSPIRSKRPQSSPVVASRSAPVGTGPIVGDELLRRTCLPNRSGGPPGPKRDMGAPGIEPGKDPRCGGYRTRVLFPAPSLGAVGPDPLVSQASRRCSNPYG